MRRLKDVENLLARVKARKARITGCPGHVLMPDASVFLQCKYFRDPPWGTLTLPYSARLAVRSLVVEQLDGLKARVGHVARTTLKPVGPRGSGL
jgi:hypothetical protein